MGSQNSLNYSHSILEAYFVGHVRRDGSGDKLFEFYHRPNNDIIILSSSDSLKFKNNDIGMVLVHQLFLIDFTRF